MFEIDTVRLGAAAAEAAERLSKSSFNMVEFKLNKTKTNQ
jgi:hypothetical protein